MPMFRLELIMPGLARFLRVVLVTTALCAMAALPRLGLAQNKGKTARSGARTLLKSERDYLSAVGSDDSPLKTGAKVELIFQNGKRQEGMVVTEVRPGTAEGTLKSVGVKSSKGK